MYGKRKTARNGMEMMKRKTARNGMKMMKRKKANMGRMMYGTGGMPQAKPN
tara:strand:+ start:415 stop:567 length:153 start_codon:yes stop_codon:yes gene_type:complete